MIIYLWTAPGANTAAFHRACGVSDDQNRACHAAEVLLRTGQAVVAYVECAYTAIGAASLSLCYVLTGTGWSARLGQGGQVVWTPYAAGGAAAMVTSPGALGQ